MISDRSSIVKIGEKEYELILTTKATKEIAKRYGGLENLGDKLMKSENFEMAISEIIWLLTLLANQSLLIHNLKNPKDKKDLLTEILEMDNFIEIHNLFQILDDMKKCNLELIQRYVNKLPKFVNVEYDTLYTNYSIRKVS